ncbi:MAG: Holliday junction branch migration protein RuvA [Phycisphaerales bacterium]
MIAHIRGTVRRVHDQSIVVALDGMPVSVEVYLPRAAMETMIGRIGEPIELSTIMTIESQAQGATLVPRLLGFEAPEQRELFEHLTKVKGLGARRVLRAMAAPVGEIATAIVGEDVRALSKLPEIGKKLAESIVLELKGKVGSLAMGGSLDAAAGGARGGGRGGGVASGGRAEHASRAIAAMVKLGEPQASAEQLVDAVVRDDPGLGTADAVLAAAFARRG